MITILSSKLALKALHPLLEAYNEKGIAFKWKPFSGAVPDLKSLTKIANYSEAILIIGAPRRSPRNVLPGPVIELKNGKCIPLAWLPERSFESLSTFAKAAAEVHRRKSKDQSIAILGQRQKRFIYLASRIESLLQKATSRISTFKWTSDLLIQESMLKGLRSGLSLAIYFGHGRPIGWVGYYGTRKHHFIFEEGRPLGALLSLCCSTASRKRTGLSFAEAIPLQGAAAASFGAVEKTLHTDNTRWAVRIAKALEEGVQTIGELVVKAKPPTLSAVESYRIFGDPLAPLLGADNASTLAKKIKTYP